MRKFEGTILAMNGIGDDMELVRDPAQINTVKINVEGFTQR